MKFFMSGEVDIAVYNDFRELRNEVEQKLKQLEGKNYGDEVPDISIIPIIVNPSPEHEAAGFYKERVKYSKKNKDADIRLRIDFHEFFNANDEEKKKLLLNNILQSVNALGKKVKKGFNSAQLEEDIKMLFKME